MHQNMDIERRVFESMFSVHDHSALQFDEMLHLINNFRIQTYDGSVLDTVLLNEKAMINTRALQPHVHVQKEPDQHLRPDTVGERADAPRRRAHALRRCLAPAVCKQSLAAACDVQ
jgi:hypothetical protein